MYRLLKQLPDLSRKSKYYSLLLHFVSCHLKNIFTAHNWQKLEIIFITYPCHKIYKKKELGLTATIILKNYDASYRIKDRFLEKILLERVKTQWLAAFVNKTIGLLL